MYVHRATYVYTWFSNTIHWFNDGTEKNLCYSLNYIISKDKTAIIESTVMCLCYKDQDHLKVKSKIDSLLCIQVLLVWICREKILKSSNFSISATSIFFCKKIFAALTVVLLTKIQYPSLPFFIYTDSVRKNEKRAQKGNRSGTMASTVRAGTLNCGLYSNLWARLPPRDEAFYCYYIRGRKNFIMTLDI